MSIRRQDPESRPESATPAKADDELARRERLLSRAGRSTNTVRQDDLGFLRRAHGRDELSEDLGEAFVATATSGEDELAERMERETEAERGGPFSVTDGAVEFAHGVDESNPEDATREPFPRT